MYWNSGGGGGSTIDLTLNSNIRCIEIISAGGCKQLCAKLNSNIRCIEISLPLFLSVGSGSLNSNIRCIEMISDWQFPPAAVCWIVTLDVLKYGKSAGKLLTVLVE